LTAAWSTQTEADGIYVLEKVVGIGSRRCGPMNADKAERFVAERRAFIRRLQQSVGPA
jgi:hypothetical protein